MGLNLDTGPPEANFFLGGLYFSSNHFFNKFQPWQIKDRIEAILLNPSGRYYLHMLQGPWWEV